MIESIIDNNWTNLLSKMSNMRNTKSINLTMRGLVDRHALNQMAWSDSRLNQISRVGHTQESSRIHFSDVSKQTSEKPELFWKRLPHRLIKTKENLRPCRMDCLLMLTAVSCSSWQGKCACCIQEFLGKAAVSYLEDSPEGRLLLALGGRLTPKLMSAWWSRFHSQALRMLDSPPCASFEAACSGKTQTCHICVAVGWLCCLGQDTAQTVFTFFATHFYFPSRTKLGYIAHPLC